MDPKGLGLVVVISLLQAALPTQVTSGGPSVVGTAGNEPIVRVAADGTAYVAALQHLSRSLDGGRSWVDVTPRLPTEDALAGSDSSIDIAPDGGTVAMAFGWPDIGATAVCETADRGSSWRCDPEAAPGITDRMWVHFLTDGRLILVTGEASQAPTAFVEAARGTLIFLPGTPVATLTEYSGQLGDFGQGWGPSAHDDTLLLPTYVGLGIAKWSTGGNVEGFQPAPFSAGGFPSLARDATGALYELDKTPGSLGLIRFSGTFGSYAWTEAPIVLGGNVTFGALAAGPTGKVTVLFYWAPAGDQQWRPYRATTLDAQAELPTFDIAPLADHVVHSGPICALTTCSSTGRFAGDFVSATINGAGVPWWSWVEDRPDHSTVIMAAHG